MRQNPGNINYSSQRALRLGDEHFLSSRARPPQVSSAVKVTWFPDARFAGAEIVRALLNHGECWPLDPAYPQPSRPCVGCLALEGLLGRGAAVQSAAFRALWKAPTHLLGTVAVTQ